MDPAWFIDQRVPGLAASLNNGALVGPDLQGEPSFAEEQPDTLDRIALGSVWGLMNERDVAGHCQGLGVMPPGAVQNHDGVFILAQRLRELLQEQVHDRAGDGGQDERESFAADRLRRGKEVRPVEALVADAGRTLPLCPPAVTEAAFLADPRFILEEQTQALSRIGLAGGLQRLAEPPF